VHTTSGLLTAAPWMADAEFALRGPVERVPGLFSVQHAGSVHRCDTYALRDRATRPLNVAATIEHRSWDQCHSRCSIYDLPALVENDHDKRLILVSVQLFGAISPGLIPRSIVSGLFPPRSIRGSDRRLSTR